MEDLVSSAKELMVHQQKRFLLRLVRILKELRCGPIMIFQQLWSQSREIQKILITLLVMYNRFVMAGLEQLIFQMPEQKLLKSLQTESLQMMWLKANLVIAISWQPLQHWLNGLIEFKKYIFQLPLIIDKFLESGCSKTE